MMLVRAIMNEAWSVVSQIIPQELKTKILRKLGCLHRHPNSELTLIIHEQNWRNEMYKALEVYLRTKTINPSLEKLIVSKQPKEKNITITVQKEQEIFDFMEGIQVKWKLTCIENNSGHNSKFFELRFHKQYKEKVVGTYLPYVLKRSKTITEENHTLKLYFNIYDLELTSIHSNTDLRKLLVATRNRSILVIEDIDCNVKFKDRRTRHRAHNGDQFALSGLLNCVDGLWSSCGDERIIIFTTNYKARLDPALLRPGRMDMHIHMSYCTPCGFTLLASNYLQIQNHPLFEEIELLLKNVNVTVAELAEELMKSDNAKTSLEGVTNFLQSKRTTQPKESNAEAGKEERETAGPKQGSGRQGEWQTAGKWNKRTKKTKNTRS